MDEVNFLMDDLDDLNDLEDISSPLNQVTAAIIGACIEVHRQLGPGFVPSVYDEALAQELTLRQVAFVRNWPVAIAYKGKVVGEQRLNFLIEDRIVVSVESLEALLPVHSSIMVSHLRAARKQLGLLINFNVRTLKKGVKRVVLP